MEESVCNKQNPKQYCSRDSFPSLRFWTSCEQRKQEIFLPKVLWMTSSNNQRLQNAGDNDRRPKCFCSSPVLCISFTWQMVKTCVIRLQMVEGLDAHDQITFFAFYLSILSIHTCNACVITTFRIAGSSYRPQKCLVLSFDANFSSFSLAECPPRDLQITASKQWSTHAQCRPTVFGCK